MRIAHLAEPNNIHSWRWLWALRDRGHEAVLVSLGSPTEETRKALAGIRIEEIRVGTSLPVLRTMLKVLGLRRILRALRPDVLHAHFVSGLGVIAAASGFRPLVLTAYGSDLYVEAPSSRLRTWLTRRALSRADLVTADSDDLLRVSVALGAAPDRLMKLQFGVDLDLFRPGEADAVLRRDLGIAPGDRVVYSARGLAARYNIHRLVEAMPAVLARHPAARLVVSTHLEDAKYRAFCEERVRDLGLVARTIFLPPQSYQELPRIYRLADVAVSIPATDGTPVTLLECMATGVPFVGSDVPSLREWITDGRNGFLVDPARPDLVADRIGAILADPSLCASFRAENRSRVERDADAAKAQEELLGLYRRLATGR